MSIFKAIRKHVESLYDATADVYIREEYKTGYVTKHRETLTLEAIPCHISYKTAPHTSEKDTASAVSQEIKLFCAPEHRIPSGSKITVTNKGAVVDYKAGGKPMLYESHQEIELELFEGWA